MIEPERDRGSGSIETRLSVSRDGVHWKRYPCPAYIGIGRHDSSDIHQVYIAHGMVRRGEEIWQYYYGTIEYHSVENCIYINGVFIDTEVEWLNKGKDLSMLEGRVVQLVFCICGSKLYSMQFVER